jgi:two-component system sensor histidine kinase PilS (NtrC family)
VRRLDLIEIARHAAALVAAHPDKPQDVTIREVFPSTPLIVVGDDDLLHRAIFNLLLNAVQASPPGGEVRVEAVELAHHQLPPQAEHFSRGGLMLRITDQGRGIPESIKDRLFEPFVTTKSGGSGLGLSIVHRAVEAHHGFILVDGADHHVGCRFTMILPKLGSDVAKRTPRKSSKHAS